MDTALMRPVARSISKVFFGIDFPFPAPSACRSHRKPFWLIAIFFTRRRSGRRPITLGGLLPATFGPRGKVRAVSGVGAAGAFSLKHGCSVAAGVSFGYSNF
jgi:hypothetical protein